MQTNTSTSECAFAQVVGSIAGGPSRAQFDITLLPGAASPDQISPHNCSSAEPSVCPQLLQMLYSSLDCPHLYPQPPPSPPPPTPPSPSPPPPTPPPPSPPSPSPPQPSPPSPSPPPPAPPPPSQPPLPPPATPPGLTTRHTLVVIFTVTSRRRRLVDSTIMSRVRLQLATLLGFPAAAVTLSTVTLSTTQDQIEARVDAGVDGAAAEVALHLLRGMGTDAIEAALGLELASPPLLELDRSVVQTISPAPPPPPPTSPLLTPPPVRLASVSPPIPSNTPPCEPPPSPPSSSAVAPPPALRVSRNSRGRCPCPSLPPMVYLETPPAQTSAPSLPPAPDRARCTNPVPTRSTVTRDPLLCTGTTGRRVDTGHPTLVGLGGAVRHRGAACLLLLDLHLRCGANEEKAAQETFGIEEVRWHRSRWRVCRQRRPEVCTRCAKPS